MFTLFRVLKARRRVGGKGAREMVKDDGREDGERGLIMEGGKW